MSTSGKIAGGDDAAPDRDWIPFKSGSGGGSVRFDRFRPNPCLIRCRDRGRERRNSRRRTFIVVDVCTGKMIPELTTHVYPPKVDDERK